MSLSRPVKFPLLKLPFLCIEAVIKSSDIFDIILFPLISKKTRQIVKSLKIRLNRIRIILSDITWIEFCEYREKVWHFAKSTTVLSNPEDTNPRKYPLVLQKDAIPLYTSNKDFGLESYSRNEFIALKMAMDFLNEVFKCSVETVIVKEDYLPELGDIGVKSTVNLYVDRRNPQPFSFAQSQKLNMLMRKLEVTDTCRFMVSNPGRDFYCAPKSFKCKTLVFWPWSAVWVTRETLLQFEVPRLTFYACPFSEEDIAAFVTHWFHSDNRNIEYLHIEFEDRQIRWEKFQMKELNPLSFSERTRVPSSETFRGVDFSKGLEIVRHDGLQATIHVNNIKENFLFYIWHEQ